MMRLVLLSTLLGLSLCLQGAIIYVNPSAGGANTGLDWPNAFTDLQPALAAALPGDEIWVAQGVYVPSVELDVDESGGTDPREVVFQLPSGVALYGGFAGGEMNRADRDWTTNLTILSGDIGGDDLNLDGNQIAETTSDLVGSNAYHVLYTQSVAGTTVLDGFILTAGQADGVGFTPHANGGGWYNDDNPPGDLSSPTIQHCRFSGNYASRSGGGLYFGSFTAGTYAPQLTDCQFSGNEAFRSGGALYLLGDQATIADCSFSNNQVTAFDPMMNTLPGSGGAAMLVASNAQFSQCTFTGNSATGNATGAFEGGGGGAVYIVNSTSPTDNIGAAHPRFEQCDFYQNSVGGNGGAWGGAVAHLSDGGNLSVTYESCVFWNNSATDDGGAVASFARTLGPPAVLAPILEPQFINCTFAQNQAGNRGGAMYSIGFVFNMAEMLNATIVNSILYGNTAGISGPEVFAGGNQTFSYSLIQGSNGSPAWNPSIGIDGGNNLDADPLFTDALTGDLTLQAGSPAVDAGDDGALTLTEDLNENPRIQGTAVDMGALESAHIGGPSCALPLGLSNADIGQTGGYAGSVCYEMGTYTVDASGNDIWWRKDGFHFIYRKLSGNGEIIARVDDLGYNNFWDLAGVMMRKNLSPGSPNVLMAVNAGGLAFMQRRRFSHGLTGIRYGGNGSTPRWVKIIRYGNWFSTYKSSNGSHWTWVATTYVSMPSKIYVGLATSTPLQGTPNTYTLSHLSIDGVSYKRVPFELTESSLIQEVDGPRPEEKLSAAASFSLGPNPTKGKIHLEIRPQTATALTLQLWDLQGRKVYQESLGQAPANTPLHYKLDLNAFPNGTYLLEVRGQEQVWQEKVVLIK